MEKISPKNLKSDRLEKEKSVYQMQKEKTLQMRWSEIERGKIKEGRL